MAILNTSRPRKFWGGGGFELPNVYDRGFSFNQPITSLRERLFMPTDNIIKEASDKMNERVQNLKMQTNPYMKSQFGTSFKQQTGTTYNPQTNPNYKPQLGGGDDDDEGDIPETERGPLRAAGAVVPALRGLGYGLGYKNLKKTYNAAKDYKIRTPIMEAEIAPVMPIRGLGRADVDAAEQAMAPTSPKYSDMTANIIADQMNNQNKMGMANNYAKFASDFLQKERERYSTQVRENAKATIRAMNTNMKAATDNANKYDKEMADLKARYLTGKGLQTSQMLGDIAKKITERGQFAYDKQFREQEMGRRILNDKIAMAQDAIERGIDVPTNQNLLDGYYSDLAADNYTKYLGNYTMPSWNDIAAAGLTGTGHARFKKD